MYRLSKRKDRYRHTHYLLRHQCINTYIRQKKKGRPGQYTPCRIPFKYKNEIKQDPNKSKQMKCTYIRLSTPILKVF